jgi:Flp pilus assembly protein TadB
MFGGHIGINLNEKLPLLVLSVLLLLADIVLAAVITRCLTAIDAAAKLKHWIGQKLTRSAASVFGNTDMAGGSYGFGRNGKRDSVRRGLFRRRSFSTGFTGMAGSSGSAGSRINMTEGLSLLERIELMYIEKSNIRHYLPFMNVYVLILTVVLIFIAVYGYVYKLLDFAPSAAVISGVLSLAPAFALELLARYNSETIRKRLSEYISVLSRWCSVKEDIIYAFEKSLGSNIGEPLSTFVRDMVIQVNRGMDPCEAIDMLRMKVDDPQFSDFAVNIKLSIRHRGDIKKLLSNLENQFYKIDEEYNRRKISTYRDRMLIYFIMFAVPAVAYLFISLSPKVSGFYLGTLGGKLLLTAFSCLYAFGFYLTAGITRFRSRG